MPTDRNFSLDLIRAVSMPMIIFFHYNCATVREISRDIYLMPFYGYAGAIGVTLFFVLSGAALTLSTRNNFSIGIFFKKRFLAIYPLFWTVYTLFLLGNTILVRVNLHQDAHPASFVYTILGIDGLMTYRGPNYYLIGEWFLGCLLALYLLYPALRFLFNLNKHLLFISTLALCIVLERVYHLEMPLLWFPPFRMFEFVFGMYFITFYTGQIRKQNLWLLAISASSLATLFLFHKGGSLFIFNIFLGILCFVALASLSNLLPSRNSVYRKVVGFLSKYSFAAFLLHHLMLVQIVRTLQGHLSSPIINWAVFLATLIFIYFCAFVVYNSLRWLLRTPIAAL